MTAREPFPPGAPDAAAVGETRFERESKVAANCEKAPRAGKLPKASPESASQVPSTKSKMSPTIVRLLHVEWRQPKNVVTTEGVEQKHPLAVSLHWAGEVEFVVVRQLAKHGAVRLALLTES